MKPMHRKILWKACTFILATVFVYHLIFYISKFYDEEKEAYSFGNPLSDREVSSTDSNNFNSKEYESSPSFPLNYMQKCFPSKAKLNKKKFRSQRMEDALLDRHIFKGRTGGIFLEIGGLDGLQFSNSWYFEQSLCWRGILIEGLPSSFEKMKKNRPLAVNIGQAVCSQAGVVSYIAGNNSATAGLETHMDEGFKHMWHQRSTKINVCCNPMNEILQPTMVPYLNLLSIDVEGAEEIILETFDWEKLPVEVVVVETDSRFMQDNKVDKITNFLQSKGLKREGAIIIKHSTVYRNHSFDLASIDVIAWSEYAKSRISSTFTRDCEYTM